MTLEQAKAAKLAKGFALEPVLPGSLESNGLVEEGKKRERKKTVYLVGSIYRVSCSEYLYRCRVHAAKYRKTHRCSLHLHRVSLRHLTH